jgi:hypothetical protein
MRRAALFVGFAVTMLGASPALAQPPTLDGALFSQHVFFTDSLSGFCSPGPQPGTTSYTMQFAGLSIGPYPGTFEETVNATVGPATGVMPMDPFPDGFDDGGTGPDEFIAAGQLLSLNATFSVDSPTGAVEGTKTLTAVVPADARHAGACQEFNQSPSPVGPVDGAYRDFRAFDLTYDATITTAEGDFHDEGTAERGAGTAGKDHRRHGGLVSNVNDFAESFDSSLTTPEPVGQEPTGTMVGKGRLVDADDGPVDYALKVNCDDALSAGHPFQVRWRGKLFVLGSDRQVECEDDPAIAYDPATADFDTQEGTGTGSYNNQPGWTIRWKATDEGEGAGDVNDSMRIVIENPAGETVIDVFGKPPGPFPGSRQRTGQNTATS